VLMTTDSVGGVWTYSLDLAAATAEHGVRYTLVCLGPTPTEEQRRAAARLDNVSLLCFEGRLEWMDGPWHDVDAAGEWLLDLERQRRPDIVHLNGYALGACPFEAPVVIVAHSCVLSWWRSVKGEEAPPEWDEYRRRLVRGLEGAGAVVAPTSAMLAWVPRAGEASYRVIPNGRAADLPRRGAKLPLVAAVGRAPDEGKNIAAVARAAASLPWRCMIAGETGGADLDGFDNVTALGRLGPADMRGLLDRASILAHPARYEPFGLAQLEAALAGCALVLGDIDTLREVWQDAALYINPDDDDHLRWQLLDLIEDPEERLRMAQCARARAARYAPEKFGAAYASLYAELVAAQMPAEAVAR
jgi:glycogen(starch) synthase